MGHKKKMYAVVLVANIPVTNSPLKKKSYMEAMKDNNNYSVSPISNILSNPISDFNFHQLNYQLSYVFSHSRSRVTSCYSIRT